MSKVIGRAYYWAGALVLVAIVFAGSIPASAGSLHRTVSSFANKKPAVQKSAEAKTTKNKKVVKSYKKKSKKSGATYAKGTKKPSVKKVASKKKVYKKRKVVKRRVVRKPAKKVAANVDRSAPDAIEPPVKSGIKRKIVASLEKAAKVQEAKAEAKPRTQKERLQAVLRKYAIKENVPVKLAYAVAQIESNYRTNVTGPFGSVGMMQIKYTTARGMGYRGTRSQLYQVENNVKYGMKYLSGAFRKAKGDICRTALYYNAGHYAKGMNPISARYCKKAIRMIGKKYISPQSVVAKNEKTRKDRLQAERQRLAELERSSAQALADAVRAQREVAAVHTSHRTKAERRIVLAKMESEELSELAKMNRKFVNARLAGSEVPAILAPAVAPSDWLAIGEPAGKSKLAEKRALRAARAKAECDRLENSKEQEEERSLWTSIASLLTPVSNQTSAFGTGKGAFSAAPKYLNCRQG